MTDQSNGLTAEKMIAAIRKANGYVSAACHDLGCSRQHWYVKLKNFPTVQAEVEAIREKRTDYVESKMMQLIDELNPTMIIFYLKTQGKNRGYVERHELNIDLNNLSDEQLEQLAEGKDIPNALRG